MSIDKINALLRKEGFTKECLDCEYYDEWFEEHPFGSTVAYESMVECFCNKDLFCFRVMSNEIFN